MAAAIQSTGTPSEMQTTDTGYAELVNESRAELDALNNAANRRRCAQRTILALAIGTIAIGVGYVVNSGVQAHRIEQDDHAYHDQRASAIMQAFILAIYIVTICICSRVHLEEP